MNNGDIAVQKKKAASIVKWAKTVVDADGVLTMAAQFLASLADLKTVHTNLAEEVAALTEKKTRVANEFHAEQARHVAERQEFAPAIGKMRAEVHAERAKTKAQVDNCADATAVARDKHTENLTAMANELLEMEGLLEAAVDKYNQFKKEITSHG